MYSAKADVSMGTKGCAELGYLKSDCPRWLNENSFRSKGFNVVVIATGRKRKDDGKPCVESVTIILFEKTFRQTSHSFKQIFFVEGQKNHVE